MATFETNRAYYLRSTCDYDCMCVYKVVKRTAKTITLQEVRHGKAMGTPKAYRVKNSACDGSEYVRPWGNYSMSPMLSADRLLTI